MSNEDSKEINETNEIIVKLFFNSSFYESKNKEPTYDYDIKRNSRIIKILWCMLYFAAFSILTDGDLKLCIVNGMWIITIHGFIFFFAFWQTFSPNPIKKYDHFINRRDKLFSNYNKSEFEIDEKTLDKQLVEYMEREPCDIPLWDCIKYAENQNCAKCPGHCQEWPNARRIYYKQKISEQLEIIKSILIVICVPSFLYGLLLVILHILQN